jgi:NAD kinase
VATEKVKVMVMEINYKIDYEKCLKNNFRNDVAKAVRFCLNQGEEFKYSVDDFGGFILYPHALNPFLKVMETLKESKNIVILPSFNNDSNEELNAPAYLILKIGGDGFVTNIVTTNM